MAGWWNRMDGGKARFLLEAQRALELRTVTVLCPLVVGSRWHVLFTEGNDPGSGFGGNRLDLHWIETLIKMLQTEFADAAGEAYSGFHRPQMLGQFLKVTPVMKGDWFLHLDGAAVAMLQQAGYRLHADPTTQ